jgi:hypothetical protein
MKAGGKHGRSYREEEDEYANAKKRLRGGGYPYSLRYGDADDRYSESSSNLGRYDVAIFREGEHRRKSKRKRAPYTIFHARAGARIGAGKYS